MLQHGFTWRIPLTPDSYGEAATTAVSCLGLCLVHHCQALLPPALLFVSAVACVRIRIRIVPFRLRVPLASGYCCDAAGSKGDGSDSKVELKGACKTALNFTILSINF